jgi:molecular chaperone DnaK (HSP70)
MSYNHDNLNFQWGYQIGPFEETIRGVKLLLDEHQQNRYSPALASKKILKSIDKDAVEVAGDYLGRIVSHVKEVLKRRFATAFDSMELRYILTVPAVWSDKAKHSTWKAAVCAGISTFNISLISEPEAAALYCLRTIQPNSFAVSLPTK